MAAIVHNTNVGELVQLVDRSGGAKNQIAANIRATGIKRADY